MLFKLRDTGQRRVGEGARLLMKMLASEACLFDSGVHRSYLIEVWKLQSLKVCMFTSVGCIVLIEVWMLQSLEV